MNVTIPLLAGIPEVSALRERAMMRSYSVGEALFHQGDRPDLLIVLIEGQVRVWRCSACGETMTLHILGAGDVPGCVAVFKDIAYPATATALTAARALTWPAAAVPGLIRRYPVLATNALGIIGARNEELLQRLQEVSTQTVEQRVARAILRLASTATRQAASQPIELPLRRRDVAEIAVTTLHSVSRLVSRWEREGILRGGRARITLLQPEKLEQITAQSP